MIQFAKFPPGTIQYPVTSFARGGVVPFGNHRLITLAEKLTDAIVLKQTSFFGLSYLGIPYKH